MNTQQSQIQRIEALLTETIKHAESLSIRNRRCAPEQANRYVALHYIEVAARLLQGSNHYMMGDEIAGAEIFLDEIGDAGFEKASVGMKTLCAEHLVLFTHKFFEGYRSILRTAYQNALQTHCGYVGELSHNGVILLAAATIPGARREIRQDLRRRGMEYQRNLVSDITMIEKIHYSDVGR